MTKAKRVGKCLCGAVEISISSAADKIGACHCTMCRRFSGGSAFMAVHGTEQIDAKGAEHIGRYKSSDWAERGFCTQCGTPLFFITLLSAPWNTSTLQVCSKTMTRTLRSISRYLLIKNPIFMILQMQKVSERLLNRCFKRSMNKAGA